MTNGYTTSKISFDEFKADDWSLNEKQKNDTGFQQFLSDKYITDNRITFDQFNADDISVPTQLQQDQEDYDRKVKGFEEINNVTGSIPNTHIGLAWGLRNVDNKRAKAGMDALINGANNVDYINKAYEKDLADLGMKYGYSPNDIKEWQSRDWRGFITGTTEVLNDMRDVTVKSAGMASAEIAAGAGIGAAVGSVVPGVGTTAGAVAGAGKGVVAAKLTAVPLATFQDTFAKEAGSFYLSRIEQNPNMSPQEIKDVQRTAAVVGLANASLEAGVATIALPYIGKLLMKNPITEKIGANLVKDGVSKVAKELPALLSKAGAKELAKGTFTLGGVEITQEMIQEAVNMIGESHLGDDITLGDASTRLGGAAVQTVQAVGPLALLGASANVRVTGKAQAANKFVNDINKKIDEVNGVKEGQAAQQETKQTETEQQLENLANFKLEELKKKKAENVVKTKELDNAISQAQLQLTQASDLGLTEEQTNQLTLGLEQLQSQKQQLEDEYRAINTEEAVRQAKAETDTKLESVNKSIEQANNQLDANQKSLSETQTQIKDIQKQITKATKKQEDTSALSTKLEKLQKKEKQLQDKIGKQEYNLSNLEKNQEKLLGDKEKLESGVDIESVLKGKKTTLPSQRVVKAEKTIQSLEKQMQEEVEKANAKGAARVAKAIADGAKKSLDSLIKGYKEGRVGQEKETRSIRSVVTRTLREAGIKRKELGSFDSVLKKIVTLPDLVKYKKDLQSKIDEILEARNKEAALRLTEKLRKLAKPYKGSPIRGKMTPEIQRKVDMLFSFINKSIFEAGFDIQDLFNKFSTDPNAKLTTNEKTKIALGAILERIAQAEARLKEIKEQEKQARKDKKGWEGKNPKREDAIQAKDVDSEVGSYTEQRPKGNKKEADAKSSEFKNQLAQALSFINMGMTFGDLKVVIEKTAFNGQVGKTAGSYNRGNQTLTISDTPNGYAIFHEIGHYFDQKVARLFDKDSLLSLSMDYFLAEGNKTNPLIKTLHSLIVTEHKRLKQQSWFRKLSKEDQEYLLRPQEIFARVFHAAVNGVNGVKVRENLSDKVNELTYTVPETTIKDLFKVMEEVKRYRDFGAEITGLESEISDLYKEYQSVSKGSLKEATKEMMSAVPKNVGDLMYYLQLAADLRNRTSEEIMLFNNLVASLIYEGRDIRAEKKAEQQKQREADVEELRTKLKEYAVNTLNKKGEVKKLTALKLFLQNVANFETKMNTLFGSKLSEKWSTLVNDTNAVSYVHEKKSKFMDRASEIYGYTKGVKGLWGVSQLWKNYLKEEDTYTANKNGTPIQVHLNRMNIIGYYIYSQNELGKARLDKMFEPDVQDLMFGKLTEEDIKFAELCIEMADTYNDVNEVFKKDRDIDLPKRERYFPFASETQEITVQSFIENNLGYRGGSPSSTHKVNESENIYLKEINPVAVLFNHYHEVSDYVNGYLQNKELAYALKDPVLQSDIKYLYGEGILKSLLNDVDAITFGRKASNYEELNRGFNNLVNNYVVAAIAAKPTIAFKQLLSFVNYAENMPVTSFVKYTSEFMTNPRKAIAFMMKNEYLRARFEGGSQTEELAHAIESSNYSKTKKLVDLLTLNVRIGDMGAIVLGGYAEVKYLMKEKGYTEQQAFEQFIKDTARTQQFNSRASISGLQAYAKENALARGFFAFTNTPYQYLNKSYNAIVQAKRGEISKKQAAKTVFIYQVLNPFLYNTATSLSPVALLLASMYGDDDKKEEALRELLLYDLFGGALTGNMDIFPINVPEMAFRYAVGEKDVRGRRDIPLGKEAKDLVVGTGELIRDMSDLLRDEIDIEDLSFEEYLKAIRALTIIKTGIPFDYVANVVSGISELAKVGEDDEIRPVPAVLKFAGYSKKKSESIDIE